MFMLMFKIKRDARGLKFDLISHWFTLKQHGEYTTAVLCTVLYDSVVRPAPVRRRITDTDNGGLRSISISTVGTGTVPYA